MSQYLTNDFVIELKPDAVSDMARAAASLAKRHGLELREPNPGTVGPNMLYLRRPEMPTIVERRYVFENIYFF